MFGFDAILLGLLGLFSWFLGFACFELVSSMVCLGFKFEFVVLLLGLRFICYAWFIFCV